MNLHKDKELFEQIIEMTAEELNISAAIIEKDYFVTFILKELVSRDPAIIFKGGTSLSKCYKIIERFSEDIDLDYDNRVQKITESKRKKLSQTVIDVIESCEMDLINRNEIYSRRDFNKYIINYESEYAIGALKPHLIVETAIAVRSFPTEMVVADSYIYQVLMKRKLDDLIALYQLEPFNVKVQKLERTFVDKVFAICDYYLNDNIREHSRHLYDLYKLYPIIKFDEKLSELIFEVREERSKGKMCISAQIDCSINEVLGKIIEQNFYKKDYEEITLDLLFENVEYESVIENLKRIKDSQIFY